MPFRRGSASKGVSNHVRTGSECAHAPRRVRGRPRWTAAQEHPGETQRDAQVRVQVHDQRDDLGTEAALRCVEDPAPQPLRFTATDRLLDFLEAL